MGVGLAATHSYERFSTRVACTEVDGESIIGRLEKDGCESMDGNTSLDHVSKETCRENGCCMLYLADTAAVVAEGERLGWKLVRLDTCSQLQSAGEVSGGWAGRIDGCQWWRGGMAWLLPTTVS